MARRCGNCIYKNVCELYDIVQDPTHAIGCGNFLDVADVAPKSEIEELIMENESLAKTVNEANSLIRKLRNKVEKSRVEVARAIETLENEVGKIYNHYVFEDTDYADDDVAVEAAMNALTEVLNLIAEFKNKYTEEKV